MNIRRAYRPTRYTNIDNTIIDDKNLSAATLGVLIYLLSKPDDWTANKKEIQKRFSGGSINLSTRALDNCFKEMREAGYAELKPVMKKNKQGKMYFAGSEYVIFDTKQDFDNLRDCANLPSPEDLREPEDLPSPEDLRGSEISETPKNVGVIITNTDYIITNTNKDNNSNVDLLKQLEVLTQKNKELSQRITQMEAPNTKAQPKSDEKPKVEKKVEKAKIEPKASLFKEGEVEQKVKERFKYEKEFFTIMDFLKRTTGKEFRVANSVSAIKRSDKYVKIAARLREGYQLEDFYRVITCMTKQWSGDKRMINYLRPQTLFSTKFEGYLDQAINDEKAMQAKANPQANNAEAMNETSAKAFFQVFSRIYIDIYTDRYIDKGNSVEMAKLTAKRDIEQLEPNPLASETYAGTLPKLKKEFPNLYSRANHEFKKL